MTDGRSSSVAAKPIRLIVRRLIRATPERLFRAWTAPDQLLQWWGPEGVVCTQADVDLRVGGRYRIANQMRNKETIWIFGEFEAIDYPFGLTYTWCIGSEHAPPERVRVRFSPVSSMTEVVVEHENIATAATRQLHEQGWIGCLSGLDEYVCAEDAAAL